MLCKVERVILGCVKAYLLENAVSHLYWKPREIIQRRFGIYQFHASNIFDAELAAYLRYRKDAELRREADR